MIIRNSRGEEIRSVEDWFRLAPPKRGKLHWKDGRSAKELAKAWFRTGRAECPAELQRWLKSCFSDPELVIEEAAPEYEIRLDHFGGEHRNCDLMLWGRSGRRPVLVTVEAKADEEFGPVIEDYLRSKLGARSNVPPRIDALARVVFGRPVDQEIGRLRYQLLHGVAATLIEAERRKAWQAAFVVHEFHSQNLDPSKVRRNEEDLGRFLKMAPIAGKIPLTISKVRTELAAIQ